MSELKIKEDKGNWIANRKDSQPTEEGFYFCMFSNGVMGFISYCIYANGGHFEVSRNFEIRHKVTSKDIVAWYPNPNPLTLEQLNDFL